MGRQHSQFVDFGIEAVADHTAHRAAVLVDCPAAPAQDVHRAVGMFADAIEQIAEQGTVALG